MIDNRLKACMDFVRGNGIVCDVGTDHGYLAAELINKGICEKVIASDINEGPLDSAKRTVEKNGIADKVELVLSDGLKNVSLEGVSDIVIAGMGGETISAIIGESDVKGICDVRLILQPMTKCEILRKNLYEYGFEIVNEKIVKDGEKLYVIIVAEPTLDKQLLTETEALYGFFDDDDELAVQYRHRESERLMKISDKLKIADRNEESVHYKALSYKMANGTDYVNIREIYDYLDSLYPFKLQESYDNSGLLVENSTMECSRILLTLDIRNDVVTEASEKWAELIISHHPVIFNPLKKIDRFSPVFRLIENGIGAICMHTNLDIADGGTNGVILRKLAEKFTFACEPQIFDETGDNVGFGWIVTLENAVNSRVFASALKEIFGCEYVRMSRKSTDISRIAFCSGSGGSLVGLAIAKNCDAIITGDVKHDVWMDSENCCFTVFDCGHFHTENLVLSEIRRVLEEKFPQLDVEIASGTVDPCEYI